MRKMYQNHPLGSLPPLRRTDHARLDIQNQGWKALKFCDFREFAGLTRGEKGKLLIGASTLGDIRAVNILLVEEADVEYEDAENSTSLMKATLNGHAEVAAALIKSSANVNIKEQDGNTPLMEWA